MRKNVFLFLFLLAGCTHAPAPGDGASLLDGTWQLRDVRCATGELGTVGQNIAKMIASGREDEIYEVSGHSVLWHVRERSPVGNRDAYCETIFTASWDADNTRIRDSGTKLKSRESVHGFKCYEPFKAPPPEPPSEHAYELNGNVLGIHHQDPEVKVKDRIYHGCEDGSDLVFELDRR